MQCYDCNEEFKPKWVGVRRSARLKQNVSFNTGIETWQLTGIVRAICPYCGEDNDRSISQNIDPA